MATDPSVPPPALQGTVLYIEDVPVNFALVEAMLEPHAGVRLLHASTGQDGVRQVREARPDFVLLDMRLPDMSGLEVIRVLSEDIARWRLRVTILTAEHLSMDIIKAMSLGAAEYLVKPIDARALEASVRRALTAPRAR